MGTTQATMTFAEFEQLPERPGKQELLRGELIELPPAKLRHNRIAERIADRLKAALNEAHLRGESSVLGFAHHEMGYSLAGHSWVKPDASVTHAAQPEGDYYEGAPAIAIEVISPGNTVEQMDIKTDLYFEFGSLEVWRVNPKTRKIMIHLNSTKAVVRYDSVTTPLIPGFSMSIDEMLA